MAALAVDSANSRPVPLPGAVAYLTFNYDLALDVALTRAGLPIDYGLGKPGGVPLLKLHGSLSWSACPRCREILPTDVEHLLLQTRKRLAQMGERSASRVLLLATPYLASL